MQLCKKSLSRRLGPRKKAKEVLLQDACAAGKPRTKRGRTACNSVPFAKEAFLFAAIWILREIELNALDCDDVSFPGGGLVQLWLAESKTDPEAEGTLRTLQCVCEGACSQHCPLKVSADLVERAKAFHLAKGTKGPGSLCPTSGGGKASKEATVKAWQALFGKETTGHSPRRSGALHYIRQGHALQQVKHLGRWKSDVVFEYAKEAMACMPSFGRGEAKPQVEACGTVDSWTCKTQRRPAKFSSLQWKSWLPIRLSLRKPTRQLHRAVFHLWRSVRIEAELFTQLILSSKEKPPISGRPAAVGLSGSPTTALWQTNPSPRDARSVYRARQRHDGQSLAQVWKEPPARVNSTRVAWGMPFLVQLPASSKKGESEPLRSFRRVGGAHANMAFRAATCERSELVA